MRPVRTSIAAGSERTVDAGGRPAHAACRNLIGELRAHTAAGAGEDREDLAGDLVEVTSDAELARARADALRAVERPRYERLDDDD